MAQFRVLITLLAISLIVLAACSDEESEPLATPTASHTVTPSPIASLAPTSTPPPNPGLPPSKDTWERVRGLEADNVELLLIGMSGSKAILYAVENKDAEYSPVWISSDLGESWLLWGRITPALRGTKQVLLEGIRETGEAAFMMPSLPDINTPLSQPALTTVKEGRVTFSFIPQRKLLSLSWDQGESWTEIAPPIALGDPTPIATIVKGSQAFLFLSTNDGVWRKIEQEPLR